MLAILFKANLCCQAISFPSGSSRSLEISVNKRSISEKNETVESSSTLYKRSFWVSISEKLSSEEDLVVYWEQKGVLKEEN